MHFLNNSLSLCVCMSCMRALCIPNWYYKSIISMHRMYNLRWAARNGQNGEQKRTITETVVFTNNVVTLLFRTIYIQLVPLWNFYAFDNSKLFTFSRWHMYMYQWMRMNAADDATVFIIGIRRCRRRRRRCRRRLCVPLSTTIIVMSHRARNVKLEMATNTPTQWQHQQ